jgi:hypothetical protein
LQTFFNCATLLVKVLDGSSLGNGRFIFSSPSNEFMNNSINVFNEDVFYNWMDRAFMSISKACDHEPFRASHEINLIIVQAYILLLLRL